MTPIKKKRGWAWRGGAPGRWTIMFRPTRCGSYEAVPAIGAAIQHGCIVPASKQHALRLAACYTKERRERVAK